MWRVIYIKKPKNLSKEQLERTKTMWFVTIEEARGAKALLDFIFTESSWEIVEILPQELFIES